MTIDLHPFLTIGSATAGIVTVTLGVVSYIKRSVRPATRKADALSNSVIELKAESQKQSEHLLDLKRGVESLNASIAAVTVSQAELKTALFGIDGQNGLRGEVRALREEVKDLS